MAFDVAGARAAGYSDQEIADHLAQGAKFNAAQARSAGYSDSEIIDHLVSPAAPGSDANRAEHQRRLESAQADLDEQQSPTRALRRVGDNIVETSKDWFKGGLDTAATLGSQVVATPAAGIAGLAMSPASPFGAAVRAGGKALGVNVPSSADIVTSTQRALTYQPRSDVGQQAVENVSAPFTWFAGKADQAGDAAARVTGSPLIGAAVNTGIQAVPVLLSRGARAPFASAGRAAAGAARTAIGGAEGAEAAAAETRAQSAAAQAQSTAAAAANAETYARSHGLDWGALADELKTKLTDIARTSGELENLDPAALKRYATLQGLKVPVPATRGALTRDAGELLREDVAKASPEGRPIADIQNAGDSALQANLDVLRGRVAGTGKTAATATTPEEAGGVIQGAARAKAAAGKANYDRLYKVARETEPDARTSLAPVTDLLTGNPEIQHLGWVQTWLNKAAKLAGGKEGEPVQLTEATLAELDDLRKTAGKISASPTLDAVYARDLVSAIDTAMENVPAGAKAWTAARNAFKAHKAEFADQGAVADLVDNTSRTDRSLALERTADTLTKGSLEDIRKVKRTLLTGGDETTRAAGKQSWRELRAQVIDRIKRKATESAQEKPDGTNKLSVAKLKQVIDSYGPEKLEEIFGPGTAREVNRILDAARIVKYQPEALGSNTGNKVIAFLSKGLEKIPGGGKLVDLGRGAAKLKEIGANARTAEQANLKPLDEAVEMAKKRGEKNSRATRTNLAPLKTVPLSSLAAGANQK